MKTACPNCGQHFEIESENIGCTAQCTSCGKDFVIQPLQDNPPGINPPQPVMQNIGTTVTPSQDSLGFINQPATQMKTLTCEMCGSTNLMKQDGVFVCQSCGTKYSVEEAKKMMIDGIVNVNVSNEHSLDYAKSLYESERYGDALEEVQKFLKQNADNLEAMELEADIIQNHYDVFKSVPLQIKVIRKYLSNEITERKVKSLINDIMNVHNRKLKIYEKYYNHNEDAENHLLDIIETSLNVISSLDNIYITLEQLKYKGSLYKCIGENLCTVYKINSSARWVMSMWAARIEFGGDLASELRRHYEWSLEAKEKMQSIFEKYKSQYPVPEPEVVGKVKSWCYIATFIYGSYDCPQVWTLRRYRDNNLAQTFWGRVFIHTYYAISPTLIRWFGKKTWFKKYWKKRLDKMVYKLNADGISDTPYKDRNW